MAEDTTPRIEQRRLSGAIPLRWDKWKWVLLALLALGALMRFYRLTYYSLDLDESISLFYARQSLTSIVNTTLRPSTEVSPPFYFMALKGWITLFGESEVALRSLSVVLSLLYLGLLFRLGEQLFSKQTALIAVGVAAVNPYLVWFAQEVRMYALGTLLSLAGMVFFVRGLTDGRARHWVGYVLCSLLACYTHLVAALLLPAQALFLLWAWGRSRRVAARGLVSLIAVGVGYLPYAYNAWAYGGGQVTALTRYKLALPVLLRTAAQRLAVNQAPLGIKSELATLCVLGFLLILGMFGSAGAPQPAESHSPHLATWFSNSARRCFVLVHLFVPLVLIYLLSLRQPLFTLKIPVFVAAPFLLGLSLGIAWLFRRAPLLGWVALALMAVIAWAGLGYNWRPGYEKENWREAARYVSAHSQSQDAVLIHLEYYHVPFEYYYRGSAPVTYPFGSHVQSFDQIDVPLQHYTQYDTLWLVLSGEFLADPEHYVERWVADRYPVVTEVYPRAIAVKGYALQYRLEEPPETMSPVDAVFDGRLQLLGFRIDQTRLPATDVWLHPPSNWIHVTLYWRALEPLEEEFRVQARLVDHIGQVWGAQLDRERDVLHMYSPTRWKGDEVVRTDHDINLNPVTPPGPYEVEIGLVPASGEQRWAVRDTGTGSDRVVLTRVDITR